MSEELLPCPFCGGVATLSLMPDGWMVACENKPCEIAPSYWNARKEGASESWNRRSNPEVASLRAQVEAEKAVAANYLAQLADVSHQAAESFREWVAWKAAFEAEKARARDAESSRREWTEIADTELLRAQTAESQVKELTESLSRRTEERDFYVRAVHMAEEENKGMAEKVAGLTAWVESVRTVGLGGGVHSLSRLMSEAEEVIRDTAPILAAHDAEVRRKVWEEAAQMVRHNTGAYPQESIAESFDARAILAKYPQEGA